MDKETREKVARIRQFALSQELANAAAEALAVDRFDEMAAAVELIAATKNPAARLDFIALAYTVSALAPKVVTDKVAEATGTDPEDARAIVRGIAEPGTSVRLSGAPEDERPEQPDGGSFYAILTAEEMRAVDDFEAESADWTPGSKSFNEARERVARLIVRGRG